MYVTKYFQFLRCSPSDEWKRPCGASSLSLWLCRANPTPSWCTHAPQPHGTNTTTTTTTRRANGTPYYGPTPSPAQLQPAAGGPCDRAAGATIVRLCDGTVHRSRSAHHLSISGSALPPKGPLHTCRNKPVYFGMCEQALALFKYLFLKDIPFISINQLISTAFYNSDSLTNNFISRCDVKFQKSCIHI